MTAAQQHTDALPRLGRPRAGQTTTRINEYKVVKMAPGATWKVPRKNLLDENGMLRVLYWRPKGHSIWRMKGYVSDTDLVDMMTLNQWLNFSLRDVLHWEQTVSITHRD